MISAVVLTHDPDVHGRVDLLAQTVESLRAEAGRVRVYDNGSKNPPPDLGVEAFRNETWNVTSGYGTWRAMQFAAQDHDGICVVSDDDMFWRPGWAAALTDWWANAPADLLITGCHLEPDYPWNTISAAGPGHLYRESTGAASWSFRSEALDLIRELVRPIPITRQGVWDVPVCQTIRRHGYRIAQLDLADHHGTVSTWGNGTIAGYGWDLAPVRERIRA